MSFDVLRQSSFDYPKAVRAAKTKYFSEIVSNNYHWPHILFNINAVINPPGAAPLAESQENFLKFFNDKIADIRSHIVALATDTSVNTSYSAVFDHFEPVSFSFLAKTVNH